jgi:hypothetical protein
MFKRPNKMSKLQAGKSNGCTRLMQGEDSARLP